MDTRGYAGSILRVDLSTGTFAKTDTSAYADRYLGGRAMATRIYWEEVPPETAAFDPENRLIFAVGPFAGIPALGGSRWGIFGKSPHPSPERFCNGNLGGFFGAEMKFAGFDAIVLQGRCERPSILIVDRGSLSLKDAGDLWGMGAIEARGAIRERLGDDYRVAAIGQAGENLVTNAIILADGDASCSGGLGAVMGSKNLKAVAVRAADRGYPVADRDSLKEITNSIRALRRGNTKVWGMDFMAHGPNTKKSPCFGCICHCLRVDYTAENGARGKFMCQSRFFYFVQALMYHAAETDVPFLANKLCDDYGIDTWELQKLMDWSLRCFQEGLITEEGTGIPFSRVGSMEFIEALIGAIVFRRGFGDVLARGLARAAGSLGEAGRALVAHVDPYEPRLYVTNTLIFPFETREPIQQIHEVGLTLAQWASWAKGLEGCHISTDTLKGIARKFWGGEAAADLTTYEGKALAAKLIQDRQYTKESLIVCDWMYPVLDNPTGPDPVGDPAYESRIFTAATGRAVDEAELNTYGERAFNLQRAVLLREGQRPRVDDYLPAEWHDVPLAGHVADPDCIVPGKDGEIVSRKGSVIDRAGFERMRDEYYALRGWDPATGMQTRALLERLYMEDVAADLASRGLLA